jgi:hypothetical protein
MAKETPPWRQMFDSLEAPLRQASEGVAGSAEFSKMLMSATENWKSLNAKSREALAKLMHLSNIPAHSDLTKLSRQVGSLTGKVETLLLRTENLAEVLDEIRQELGQLRKSG